MNGPVVAGFDALELLHLAAQDIESQRHDAAIVRLRRALELSPRQSRAHHLLAAVHAQLGLHEHALAGFGRALELEPALHVARFQLGLLHLVAGRDADARRSWAPLDALGADDALPAFANGLLELQAGRSAAAVTLLEQALRASGHASRALRADIARALERARGTPAGSAAPPGAEPAPDRSGAVASRYASLSEPAPRP